MSYGDPILKFAEIVRREFASVAEAHGLSETGILDTLVLKRVIFSNANVVIRFYLDVRDGYVDAVFGSRKVMNPDGSLVAPAIESAAFQYSVFELLKREGVVFPDAYSGLYQPGALEDVIRELMRGITKHADVIFGSL